MNKSQYILVAIAALLALFVFTLALFSFFRPLSETTTETESFPTPTQIAIPTIAYDQSSSEKMIDILENREPLTSNDAKIRAELVLSAEKTTYLYSSKNVRVEYVRTPDEFLAEILTSDIASAKDETITFFAGKGLSADAICRLPLVFFMSINARRSMPEDAPEFNPLAEGC